MKIGWIVTLGPLSERAEAQARLEIIADTFLSVNTPAQLCLPEWLERSPAVQQTILTRLRSNLALIRSFGVEVLPVEAGWSAVLRLPRTYEAADASTALLALGLLTHPGHFFGMPESNRVVVSLLTPPDDLTQALQRVERA